MAKLNSGGNSGRQYSAAGGSVVVVAMRWTDRLIGLASTLILVRLLVPEDFGIVAVAMLAIGFVNVFLDLGVDAALIRNPHASQAHFDSAWTLRLMQTCIGAVIVISCAPLAAHYFNDARVTPVIWALAAALLLSGLENIGIVTFQKEMRFGRDFTFVFTKRIVGFIVTIVAALELRSYWALVIGVLSTRVVAVLLSYHMHNMRPRLSLSKFREIFAVSQWVLINGIGRYLNDNLHRVLVGKRADTATLGGYTLANEISAMPSTELLAPLRRVLFPAFAQVRDNPAELKRRYLLAQGVQCVIGIPVGIGLSLTASEVVHIVLGTKWLFIVPYIEVLAVFNVVSAISGGAGYLILSAGKVYFTAASTWGQVLLFAIIAGVLLPAADPVQIAWVRAFTLALGVGFLLLVIVRTFAGFRWIDIGASVVRPVLAAVIMSVAVIGVANHVTLSVIGTLLVKVGVGALTYPISILLMWQLLGRPDGAERYLLEKVMLVRSASIERWFRSKR